ncbi:MAG: LysR family transcriptional regulator [Actinomycetota bacterium]
MLNYLPVTLGQLRTFLKVAETGSIAGAAAALVVTEPSVSAAVAALRRELGADLIERAGRGIRLTEAGHELALHATDILGLVQSARRSVAEAAGGPRHVRLVAVTTAGEYVLPPILGAFFDTHPGVQVSLEVGNRSDAIARLVARDADIAVGGRPPAESGIAGEAFLENHLVVVGRSDHPLRDRRALQPRVLARETWLLREPGSGTRATTEEFFASNDIQPAAVMTIGSNGAVKEAAVVGLGVTLISSHAVARELADGRLARLDVRGTPLRRAWYALYRDGSRLSKSTALFLNYLMTEDHPHPTDAGPARP